MGTLQNIFNFFYYLFPLGWVRFLLLYTPPVVSATIVVVVLLSFIWTFLIKKLSFKLNILWLLLPIVSSLVILIIGVLFSRKTTFDWPIYLVYGLFLANIPFSVYLAFRLKPYIWFVMAVSIFTIWISLYASIMSIMCITGDSI